MQIMKSDEDVRMISAEAPVLFARVSSLLSESCHRLESSMLLLALRCESAFKLSDKAETFEALRTSA